MKFNSVAFADVQLDLDSGVPIQFNSNFHKAEEAPGLSIPSVSPYAFDKWLPLILDTRSLPVSAVQTVTLTRSQVRVLYYAAGASIHTGLLNRAYEEDLRDEVHSAFASLSFPPKGLFMRLPSCSPKDGAQTVPGQMSLRSVEDIVLRLTTSARASGQFSNMLISDAHEIRIFFLPFDERMSSEKEYRVFCAPLSLRITAVSQYRWHQPWMLAADDRNVMEATAQQILVNINEIHARVIDAIYSGSLDREDDSLIWAQGFTFDVLFEDEHCELIELNTFGARSGCGTCLFHWIKDMDILYGANSKDVEFRVALVG